MSVISPYITLKMEEGATRLMLPFPVSVECLGMYLTFNNFDNNPFLLHTEIFQSGAKLFKTIYFVSSHKHDSVISLTTPC